MPRHLAAAIFKGDVFLLLATTEISKNNEKHITLWSFNIEHGPFIDYLPIKHGDFQ